MIHTPPSSSCLPFTYRSTPLVTSSMTLDSTLSSLAPTTTPHDPPLDDLHLPIALQKGTCACTQHLIAHFVSYECLSLTYRTFALAMSSESVPRMYHEALQVPEWKADMDLEYHALLHHGTWDLVPRPTDANIVTCKWVFTLKYHPDGTVARHKSRLVARGFTQDHGIDYTETFSLVVCMNSIHFLLSLVVNLNWSLHQLDVSNAFSYGDLVEIVFMEQPLGYISQGETSQVCLLHRAIYRLKQSHRAWFVKFSGLLTA